MAKNDPMYRQVAERVFELDRKFPASSYWKIESLCQAVASISRELAELGTPVEWDIQINLIPKKQQEEADVSTEAKH